MLRRLAMITTLIVSMGLPYTASADIFDFILDQLEQQTGLQDKIEQYTSKLPGLSQNTLNALTSQAGWGGRGYNPNLQSWGNNAQYWDSVLKLYQQGGNPGEVSGIARQLNQQFPIQNATVANPNPNSNDAKYYQLQAETALASRAASQFDYNNIQKQVDYMHKLHDELDTTKDLKSSVDLNNRLQFESSMLQIELLRLAALSNQQQAISAQNQTNAIVNNANFSR